jgi:predicted ATP-grasp superfamily ATP-dependent carboligase
VSRAVVVTDGEQRAALATVRSLGAAGFRPWVCSASGHSLAGASRFAAGDVAVPDPLAAPARYADAVARLAQDVGATVLLPVAEPAMLALLEHRGSMASARIPFPDVDAFRRLSDKAELMRVAPEVGIRVPEQCTVASPGARQALLASPPPFPMVLKPARSVGEADGRRSKLSVRHVADAAQLRSALDELPASAYPLLVQRRIVGPGVGIFLLVWDGRTQAVFAHRRLREKPPSGGVSVYRESIPADPALVASSRALLDRFGWFGVAMIEYKLAAASGTPYLMEINGRFWGSLQLAIDAGVDFPALLVRLALGEHPEPVTRYRAGVRSRWWWGDVDHLLARLRRSDAELALPPGSPSRGRAVLDFLTLWRPGDRNEILRWNDPMPLVRETAAWLRGQ